MINEHFDEQKSVEEATSSQSVGVDQSQNNEVVTIVHSSNSESKVLDTLLRFILLGFLLLSSAMMGCISTPPIRINPKSELVNPKSELELIQQLKAEHPDCFNLPPAIQIQDPSKLCGEWEGYYTQLVQITRPHNDNEPPYVSKNSIQQTFQFFADGTYNVHTHTSVGISSTYHGVWSYTNNTLQSHYFENNIMKRESPLKITWYANDVITLAKDAKDVERKYKQALPSCTSIKAYFSAENCFIMTSKDRNESGTESSSISVQTPLIFRRLGDAIKPPANALHEPTIDDSILAAKLEAERKALEQANEQRRQANQAITTAVVDGINTFSQQISNISKNPYLPNTSNQGSANTTLSNPTLPKMCPVCRGTGKCRPCNGTGDNVGKKYSQGRLYDPLVPEKCSPCGGTGNCIKCKGNRYL